MKLIEVYSQNDNGFFPRELTAAESEDLQKCLRISTGKDR
jgi:hypothetical protein